eukprot:2750473-Lingulodinium_polyedra.AAC.1
MPAASNTILTHLHTWPRPTTSRRNANGGPLRPGSRPHNSLTKSHYAQRLAQLFNRTAQF